uniref:Uncharacterized protein n=1 Tax=Parascaris univalens TaxID=6257 RepID=A0A914ZLW5_PARUN
MGNLILVDADGALFLVSNLRTPFDDSTVRATVEISPAWADPAGCPQYFRACDGCQVAEHVAEVRGRNTTQGALSSSRLDAFRLQTMRSLSIDLGWAKACANLTQLHHGTIEATATIRRYSPVSARPIGTFRLLENVLSGRTEITVEHSMKQITSIELHQRGVDMSVTSGPPCGELTIGSKEHYQWLKTLQKVLNSTHRKSRIVIDGRLITEANILLGKTVLISDGADVACGTIEAAGERKIAGAKFEGKFKGRIKMVQTSTGPQGLPTEVFYYFEQGNEVIPHRREDQRLEWSVVSLMNSSCENSLIFNPFQYDDSQCGSHAEFCPLGDLSKRSSLLELNIRRQVMISDLSLSGPLSVSHRWIRVRPANDVSRSECAPVEEWYEETFRWTALSSRTLSQLQNELAERFGVEPFQVVVHYNRELIGSRCSIYRITLTASKDVLASGLSLFNREERRFYSDEELRCSNDTAATHVSSSASQGFDVFAIAYRSLIIASAVLFLRNL